MMKTRGIREFVVMGLLGSLAARAQDVRFEQVQPNLFSAGGTFVNAWADYDSDGDLDISLTDSRTDAGFGHSLLRNDAGPDQRRRSLFVKLVDARGRDTRAGDEVRLLSADGQLLATRLVPTGDGYDAQGTQPVHFGLAGLEPVIVEAVFLTADGRKTLRVDADPRKQGAKPLVLQQP